MHRMKRTLMVTCLLAGACVMFSPKSTVQAQDRQVDKAAHARRGHTREQRAVTSFSISPVPLNDASDSIVSKVQRGLDSSPVPLNLDGKDIGLVGLGSYLVNLQSSCNDCHSAGPATQYAGGGNPFFSQTKM